MQQSSPWTCSLIAALAAMMFCAHAIALKPRPDAGFKPSSTVVFTITRTLEHDSNSFTEGLAVCGGTLIESVGLYGVSALIRRQIDSGAVLARHALPADVFGEGATCFRDHLYQLTWREHMATVYDDALESIRVLRYDGEGWGLTHDDEQLIMSDGTATISFRDADDFSINRTIDVHDGETPITRLNELEFAHGLIFANIWQQDRVAIIDPADGAVLGWLELGALADKFIKPARWNARDDVLNGIAYDTPRDRWFVTGKRWPVMFELKLEQLPSPSSARAGK